MPCTSVPQPLKKNGGHSISREAMLPHRPRPLTPSERRHKDWWRFESPKLERVVDLLGPLALLRALVFEFDPCVIAYVERPRVLDVGREQVELDFWTSEPNGTEKFWLLVANDDAISPGTPRRQHRRATALVEAANAAHLNLAFVFEVDAQRHAATLSTYRRLLPYVQTAHRLPNRDAIRARVCAVFDGIERASIQQICAALAGFNSADVKAGIADLIHQGELQLANAREISRLSVVERRVRHVAS